MARAVPVGREDRAHVEGVEVNEDTSKLTAWVLAEALRRLAIQLKRYEMAGMVEFTSPIPARLREAARRIEMAE